MMKLRFGVVALACFTAVGLSAQTTPPSGGQPAGSSATQSSSSDAQKVTVSGCLERAKDMGASAGTSGTAGTAGATGSASASASSSSEGAKYVLNNVSPTAAGATGTSGTSGATGAGLAAASSYRLDGDDAKLSPHVGHKIEVTGSVQKSASASASATATGASASASAPKLKVESVKMIASSCTP
jgi:hypothetical protein